MTFIEALEIVSDLAAETMREHAYAHAQGTLDLDLPHVEMDRIEALTLLSEMREELVEQAYIAGLCRDVLGQ